MIKSEWIKLWSVRSTYWTLATAATLMLTVAVIFSATTTLGPNNHPTDALQGAIFAQLAFGSLGVLVISSEYTTGLIGTTFAAVPERRKAVLAKGGVLFAVLAVAGQALALASYLTAQAVFAHRGLHASLADHGTAASVAGIGFYVCFVGMFGFALGVLLRRTVPALSTLFGIVFIGMEILIRLLPAGDRDEVGKFTFGKIAQAMAQTVRQAGSPDNAGLLSTGTAWLVCAAYLVVAIAVPLTVINRRDAT